MQDLIALHQGQIFARGPLKRALETAPSGEAVTLGHGDTAYTIETVLTFRNRRQSFCRQYDVSGQAGNYAGVACRSDNGEWRLEIHLAVAPPSKPGDRIRPAGQTGSAVEDAVNNVIEGDAMGQEDEKALIRNSWCP